MQCDMMPCNDISKNTQYSLNRIYMILLGNTSRVHDPWETREVHIPTRTISTCLCGRSQCTMIKLTISARTVSACPNYDLNISPSQHGWSPPAQLILNLMSMHVHNIISNTGMMMHLIQSSINIIHNHLNNHNYTGVTKKTQSHKDFKSIIHQLMPICFGILNF